MRRLFGAPFRALARTVKRIRNTTLCLGLCPALASGAPAYGPELQGFDYPYPVATFAFFSQRQDMHMAYMDV